MRGTAGFSNLIIQTMTTYQLQTTVKRIGTERFSDLQKVVKEHTRTDNHMEFEKLYLTMRQESSSKNKRGIRFRDTDYAIIENDLLEDLDGVEGVCV